MFKNKQVLIFSSLGLMAAPLFATQAQALDGQDNNGQAELESVRVTAKGQALADIAQPVKVLGRDELQQASGDTLGEILDSLPGVSNASFGGGVGRPVLRGMAGNRVKVAINGSDSADVSAMSSDHAPMADAANAKQVEVIYGPATLLYGSGAIGGVVNLVDERFHEVEFHGSRYRLESEISSGNGGRSLSASVDTGAGNWVWHMDGFSRSSDDFGAGSSSEFADTVVNTDTQSMGGNVALNWVHGGIGYSGLALSMLEYEYGVPNANDERATVAPTQVRLDAVNAWHYVHPNIELIKTQFSINDYEHVEGTNGSDVGFFDKYSSELKTTFHLLELADWQSQLGVHLTQKDLALCHDHDGCEGVPDYSNVSWDGSKGTNFQESGGFEFAHDTPMPETQTQDVAGFMVLSRPWSMGMLEMGARVDRRVISADPVSIRTASRQAADYYKDKTFNTSTFSMASTFQLNDAHKLGISLARAQRAPEAEELYWNGDHHATFSYQLDNNELIAETANTLDLTWQYFGDLASVQGAVYFYDFNDYIYNDLKDVPNPNHPGDAVYRHEQADAYLTGFEISWQQPLGLYYELGLAGDYVRARLKNGDNKNLPRTPPASLSTTLNWQKAAWRLKGRVQFYAKQSDVALNETPTDAYGTLNLLASYDSQLTNVPFTVALKGNNLLNEFGRNHVSYLKEFSPVMGRNISLQISTEF